MTAKSRRRKFDKRRKTDDHSHPRSAEGTAGRPEEFDFEGFYKSLREAHLREDPSARRSVYVPEAVYEQAEKEGLIEEYAKYGVDIRQLEPYEPGVTVSVGGRLTSASRVAAGNRFPGSKIEFEDISPEAFDLIAGGQSDYIWRGLGDHGELTAEGFAKQRALEEGLRASGSSDSASSAG